MTYVTFARHVGDYRPIIEKMVLGRLAMTQSNLTRWIEIADARQASEVAMVGRVSQFSEGHYLHLGEAIAKMSSWVGHGFSRDALAAVGCHARARARRPLSRLYH